MNLKNWDSIYRYWLSLNVPNITFLKFDPQKHSPNSPWFEKERKVQLYFSDNPVLDTGAHLGRYLKDKPQELIDAYKIFAFLRSKQLDRYYNFIDEAFKKYNENFIGWWNANAKHIFPYYSSINDRQFMRPYDKPLEIKDIINSAGKAWMDISNEWELIIIPDYLEFDSPEKLSYLNDLAKEYEAREYANYLRLKEKFEGRTTQNKAN